MKKSDFIVASVILLVALLFILFPILGETYNYLNDTHGMWMSFVKFGILATFGESLALRIKTGKYNALGFGLFPKAIIWGFLGLTIKLAFVVFSVGVPAFLAYLGFKEAPLMMQQPFGMGKLVVAFCISAAMNLIYAPVMMSLHRVTDAHVSMWNGSAIALLKPMKVRRIFNEMDWGSLWNFVFKKTIPIFWIPAHTITFLLPENAQVLFAAFLSLVLGVILSFAIRK